ncbi:MAG TPA: DNA polymerase III subunit [Methylomirabilota bacterium]|nr:DNA polymerase III subunit [Methylomirabilota bacterium]
MDWQIDGHKRQLEFLEKAVENGKLAHGLLFAGPTGVGKKTIALKLAHKLLGENPEKFSADLLEIDGIDGIKIEQIRDLAYKLSLKPYSAQYKVAIIDSADQMTLDASNALLKVLEEPKSYTIIILITSNPNRIPKTIISRTQKITFGMVKGREAQPRPDDHYEIFSSQDLAERLILAASIADLETSEIKNILQSWLIRLVNSLHENPNLQLKQKIDQIILSQKYLDGNLNNKLLLTNLMIST